MPVDRATVEHVARLARLELDDREAERLALDLDRLVGWVDRLAAIDTEGVEPMTHPPEVAGHLRPDVAHASLPLEEVLDAAPATDPDGSFRVPPVRAGEGSE